MSLSEQAILDTAKELRAQVRQRAGLNADWNKITPDMKAWYLMLARRAEGIDVQ